MTRAHDIPKTAAEQIALLPSTLSLWQNPGAIPADVARLILFGETDTLTEVRARIPHDDLADWGLAAVEDDPVRLPGELDTILSDADREIEAERLRLISTLWHSSAAVEWIAAKHGLGGVFVSLSNLSMQSKLNAGTCIDVSPHRQPRVEGEPQTYLLPEFAEGFDYADAEAEAWIWSIGRHVETGRIYASTGSGFYQRPGFTCLFLRCRTRSYTVSPMLSSASCSGASPQPARSRCTR